MKRIIQKPNPGIVIMILSASFLFTACSKFDKNIVFTDSYGFTQIEIKNPSGQNVVLAPLSEREGAVGVKTGQEVFWLTGKPKKRSSTEFVWELNSSRKVLMTLNNSSENVSDFSFRLDAGKGTAAEWYINIRSDADEYFTGIFERVVDGPQKKSWEKGITTGLNLRGQVIEMHLKPTVSAYAPFYISSDNYGLFVQGTWPGVFDFCSSDTSFVKVAFEGTELNCDFLLGTPLEIVQKHALQTGPSIIPPKWALGPWRWRDEHFNNNTYYDGTVKKAPFNTDIMEDVLMMKALDIPATAFWIDRPWAGGSRGFDDYEFDTNRIPNPDAMIKWLNSRDIELMIWIAPFVMGKMADYAEEKGYYLVSKPWYNSRQILIDFTNPEAVKWWGENGPGKLARMGIKGFKLDRADGEKLMDTIGYKTFIGITYRENFNDYPRQYVKATYASVQPVLGSNFILFPRAQFTRSARYGAMWAGDTDGSPEGLRSAIIGMQRCAIMGYPIWASDIGGYWGNFSRETCMHWIAFGCFCPIMETGPTNNRGFWNNPDEPHYDKEMLAIWRLYSKIRMKLVPYLFELAKEANEKGTPVIRPLFLNYPEQKDAWNDWQTYMLGNDLLVAPVWEKDSITRNLYLPGGEQWINAWDTDRIYEGGEYLSTDAPLYKIPVFIRKGSGLDMGDLNALYLESQEKVKSPPDLKKLESDEGWK
jgi:alpha-D-xyloside xylohydrolase